MRSDSDFVARPFHGASPARSAAGSAKPGGMCWRILAGVLGVAAATLPAQAINVYVMSSGDATLDTAVQDLLTANGDTSTIGQEYWEFDGSQWLAGDFDAVYMQVNYNFTSGDMPIAGQEALLDYLNAGGGLVTSEWAVYEAAAGYFQSLQAYFPAEATPPGGGYDARLPGVDPLTLLEMTNDPVLSTGLPTSFSFATDTSHSGALSIPGVLTECFPRASLPGAVEFYQAQTPTSFVTSGLVGAQIGQGAVINVNAVCGPNEIADANFGQLLVNSLVWVSSGSPAPGTNLVVHAGAAPDCVLPGNDINYSVRTANLGADTSGPITLTVDLPDASIATYTNATPAPSSVTLTALTFDLSPLASTAFSDVSITLTAQGGGTASITATAATAGDTDPTNNSASAVTNIPQGPTADVYIESGDAPDLAGGIGTYGSGSLTAIEGTFDSPFDADMYRIRVDDWSIFSADMSANPVFQSPCGGDNPVSETLLCIFDSTGHGIALNDDGGDGDRARLEAGNPIYSGRTNGEIVWLAVSGNDLDPTSGGFQIWQDVSLGTTVAPDDVGADGAVDGWSGVHLETGSYRVSLQGVSYLGASGPDLAVQASMQDCALVGESQLLSIQVHNYGPDTTGPVTLTVHLPDPSVATYADATPAPSTVTSTALDFDLAPIAGNGGSADVSVSLTAQGEGAASITATAATAGEADPSNNSASAEGNVGASLPHPADVYVESGDAAELAGGQQPSGSGVLTAIEGALTTTDDVDMYTIRVDDWSTFSADSSIDPSFQTSCVGTSPFDDTSMFLFDATGHGIAFNDDGGSGVRARLEAGSPVYAGRTNGEIVWIAISGYDRDPNSGGSEIWADDPYDITRAPDGPAADGAVDTWSGSHGDSGTYRISLQGASYSTCPADLDGSGTVDVFDLLDYLALWFPQDPAADIDGTPGVDVFDLLAYLTEWFAGC